MQLLIESTANESHSLSLFSLLSHIKKLCPYVQVSVLVQSELTELFKQDTRIKAVYADDASQDLSVLLRSQPFDLCLSLSQSKRFAYGAKRAAIPKRVAIAIANRKKYAFTDLIHVNGLTHIENALCQFASDLCRTTVTVETATDAFDFISDTFATDLFNKRCHSDKKTVTILLKKEFCTVKSIFVLKDCIERMIQSNEHNVILINESKHNLLKRIKIIHGSHIIKPLKPSELASIISCSDYVIGISSWATSLASLYQKPLIHLVTKKSHKFCVDTKVQQSELNVDTRLDSFDPNTYALYEQFQQLLYDQLAGSRRSLSNQYLSFVLSDFKGLILFRDKSYYNYAKAQLSGITQFVKLLHIPRWGLFNCFRFFKVIFSERISFVHGEYPTLLRCLYQLSKGICVAESWPKVRWINTAFNFTLKEKAWASLYLHYLRQV